MGVTGPDASRIHDLGALLAAQDQNRLPPVETWDPPHRGDIGLAIAFVAENFALSD